MTRRRTGFVIVWAFALASIRLAGSPDATRAGHPASWSDFNADGYSDLAIGTPYITIAGLQYAGAIVVLYGSPNGLTSAGSQTFNANNVLPTNDAQVSGSFGHALASGDFDKDGYGDLAISAPFKNIGASQYAGRIYILFGSPSGLTTTRTKTFAPSIATAQGAGYSLVTLDWFDLVGPNDGGDGYADLAIAVPGPSNTNGKVVIVPGQRFMSPSNPGKTTLVGPDPSGTFGWALAAGDFDRTRLGANPGLDDLAIGAPYVDVNGKDRAGRVYIAMGETGALAPLKVFDQDAGTIPGVAETQDGFGNALAAGDVTGDGLDDLAVGVPGETLYSPAGPQVFAGLVDVIPSDPAGTGLKTTATQLYQGSAGLPGVVREYDEFGSSLVIDNLGSGGKPDLVIGARGDSTPSVAGAGTVTVIYTGPSGLQTQTAELWHQGSSGIPENPQPSDEFGRALASGQYGNGSVHDLAVAAMGDDVVPELGGSPIQSAGVVNVIYGSANGLASANAQVWSEESPGVPRVAHPNEFFGYAVR